MLSIVLPTHNRLEDLRRALISLKNQTVLPAQVIVVDDGSDEAVPSDIFKGLDDISCEIIRLEVPGGAARARNIGVYAAQHEWVAFLDDDDEFLTNKVEALLQSIKLHGAQTDCIYHPALINMVNEKAAYRTKPRSFRTQRELVEALLTHNAVGGTPVTCVKRESFIRVGGFDEALPALEDYDLWLRMAIEKMHFRMLDIPLTRCNYFTRRSSISKSVHVDVNTLSRIYDKHEALSEGLTAKQWKRRKTNIFSMLHHKACLNYQYFEMLRWGVKLVAATPSRRNFMILFISLFGARSVFVCRSYVEK